MAIKHFDAQLARQDAKDAQYQQDRTQWQAQMVQHDKERVQQAQEIAQLQAQIAHRDSQPLPKPIQEGLKSDATLPEVELGLREAFNGVPGFSLPLPLSGPYVQLTGPQAQAVTISKVTGDTAKEDLKDEKSTISLLNTANSSLSSDLNQCKALNTQANKDIAGFKKLAERSKWQRFMPGAEKVGLLLTGAAVGHMI